MSQCKSGNSSGPALQSKREGGECQDTKGVDLLTLKGKRRSLIITMG